MCIYICVYRVECYLAIKKECNVIMLFAATWINLKIILLTEVNQTEKGKYHTILLYVKSIKMIQINFTKQK